MGVSRFQAGLAAKLIAFKVRRPKAEKLLDEIEQARGGPVRKSTILELYRKRASPHRS